MRADPGSLYDAHAARLYAYCWSLVGDRAAADAVIGTFVAAVRHPPRGDTVLWLYALARSACMDRGALGGLPNGTFQGPVPSGPPAVAPVAATGAGHAAGRGDPLLRAAAGLRADHREVLLLWAGEWLEIEDIARVLGVAPDTARGLLNAARARLDRAVLDGLMRAPAGTRTHLELIGAFEKGRLPQLLARRVPAQPPRDLRGRVLAACEAEERRPVSSVTATSPLVVIGPERTPDAAPARSRRGKAGRGKARKVGVTAGLTAAAAAAVGLLISWPAGKGGDAANLVPTSRGDHAEAGSNRPTGGTPGTTDSGRLGGLTTSPFTQSTEPAAPPSTTGGGSNGSGGSGRTGGGTPSGGGGGSSTPDDRRTATISPSAPASTSPGTPSATPSSPAQTPAPSDTATPGEPGTGAPSAPSSPPPAESPEPPGSPTPTSNPTPSPSGD